MRTIDPALERVWELMRHNHADIINQSLPPRMLQLLDALEQKERALDSAVKARRRLCLEMGVYRRREFRPIE